MARTTPLLHQYRTIKSEHPDAILFFRLGDFYEMFERDAEVAARELDLTLTSKPVGKDVRVPLAGIPWHQMESYALRLTRRGYRVAVCDQLEDPKKAKGIVRRGVTRILSPGTAVSEDEAARNLYVALVSGAPDGEVGFAVALADLSTGEMEVGRFETPEETLDALLVAGPREVFHFETPPPALAALLERYRARVPEALVEKLPSWTAEPSWGVEVLKKHLGGRLEGYGLREEAEETVALGALLAHLKETQGGALPHFTTVRRIDARKGFFALDEATAAHLEVIEPAAAGTGRAGPTLFSTIDATKTAMGKRLLRRALLAPLTDPAAIVRRADAVAELVEDAERRRRLREALAGIADLERLLGRAAVRAASPRELLRLGRSLAAVREVAAALDGVRAAALVEAADGLDGVPEVEGEILAALVEDPPLRETEGGLIRENYDEELDAIRAGAADARKYLAELQERERKRTGIASLRVKYNKVFGYFIEVTKANLDKVPPDYERRQTLANAERYTTPEMRRAEACVLGAAERATAREVEIFRDLIEATLRRAARIRSTAARVAEVDFLQSLAETAAARGWVRPEILPTETRRSEPPTRRSEPRIEIEDGRHPVLERTVERFIPNDFTADDDARFFLITGPNMGGKSTYLRQTALIVLLAQIGSFVPARRARIAPVGAIFSRVGASDRIAEGLSTFMVEMVETASILRRAGPDALVLLDEVGRGTATYDGLSIAWAVSEFLLGKGATVLFATHYFELTDLARLHRTVRNRSVAVREWKDEVVFLHEIVSGPADRSYGIEVAKLAGLPEAVVRRAREILRRLEMSSVTADGTPRVADAADDAPLQGDLFGAGAVRDAGASAVPPAVRALVERTAALDPDDLSPRAAHAVLCELVELAKAARA